MTRSSGMKPTLRIYHVEQRAPGDELHHQEIFAHLLERLDHVGQVGVVAAWPVSAPRGGSREMACVRSEGGRDAGLISLTAQRVPVAAWRSGPS